MPGKRERKLPPAVKEEKKIIDAEIVEDGQPKITLNRRKMTIEATKQYATADKILDMPIEEAMALLNNQITAKLLLINEQIIKWLEVLDSNTDWAVRASATQHIQTLTTCAAQIAHAKSELKNAIGSDALKALQEGAKESTKPPEKEITPEEFMTEFVKEKPAEDKPLQLFLGPGGKMVS